LRSDAFTRDIPVHFVSALDAQEEGLALGAVGYLTKPASPAQLREVVHALTQRGPGPTSCILVGDAGFELTRSLRAFLEAEELSIRHAVTVSELVDAVELTRFAGIVVDGQMPDGDPIELMKTLRERARASIGADLHIVLYTHDLSAEQMRSARDLADAVVLKEGRSTERLMAELRLFVQHVRDGLGPTTSLVAVSPTEQERVNVRLDGHHILIVDDDMRTVYALSALLHSKGAEVTTADNGKRALDALRSHPNVSCLITDIMTPEMDGFEAIRRIRGERRFETLPIIAITAKARAEERQECLDAGATAHVAKPIDSMELISLLQKHLDRKEGSDGCSTS
jgi:CheY-like chemotaxis protein